MDAAGTGGLDMRIRSEQVDVSSRWSAKYAAARDAERGVTVAAGPNDEALRREALGAVGGVRAGEDATSTLADADAVFRWLKYGPEQPADPTLTDIVGAALNDVRGARYQASEAIRSAAAARSVAEIALKQSEEALSGSAWFIGLFVAGLLALGAVGGYLIGGVLA